MTNPATTAASEVTDKAVAAQDDVTFIGYFTTQPPVKPFDLESDEPLTSPACSLDGGSCESCQ